MESEAEALPDGPAKIALFEEALRLAEFANETVRALFLRSKLVRAAMFGGRADLGIVTFVRNLAEVDRLGSNLLFDLMFISQYKWVVSVAIDFPSISRPQLEQLFEDLSRRFKAAGALYSMANCGRTLASATGRLDEALAFDAELSMLSRDSFSDCEACDMRDQLLLLIEVGRFEEAIARFERYAIPKQVCSHEPQRLMSTMLEPYRRIGNFAEAQRLHNRSYKLIANGPIFTSYRGDHLVFLALTGQDAGIRRLLQCHTDAALTAVNPSTRYCYVKDAYLGLKRLAHGGVTRIKLELTEPLDVRRDAKGYDVAALVDWFHAEAERLANLFDRRNGNSSFHDGLVRRIADFDEAIRRGDKID